MRVRGPVLLCLKEPPADPEPRELPLLLSTRRGVEGGVAAGLLAESDCVDLVLPNLSMPCRKAIVGDVDTQYRMLYMKYTHRR